MALSDHWSLECRLANVVPPYIPQRNVFYMIRTPLKRDPSFLVTAPCMKLRCTSGCQLGSGTTCRTAPAAPDRSQLRSRESTVMEGWGLRGVGEHMADIYIYMYIYIYIYNPA